MADQQIIKLSQLEFDKKIYPRYSLDKNLVMQYRYAIELGADFPPIVVGIYNGKKIVIDGYHRVSAYRELKKDHIDAIVKEIKTERELYIESVKCNISNGKPFDRKERIKIIEKLNMMNLSPVDISNIILIPKSDVCTILKFSSMRNPMGNTVDINAEIRNEVIRDRINFTLNDKSFLLLERFSGFYDDLKQIKESKRKISAVERTALLDIVKIIQRIIS
ncbi:MAG: ParB N-terminal domain-containing protein [Actinobacteria bacterium]|nr:ParB N-terminal domain-containing protein [Actinomycetota bacterium]MBE3122576.1 ParB N-terminal domain-containing protein [Thermoplasmata archaeon]